MDYMTHSSHPRNYPSRRSNLRGSRPALERIDARLKRAHLEDPEDETEKIKHAMLILFGPEPIGFHSPANPPTQPIQPS